MRSVGILFALGLAAACGDERAASVQPDASAGCPGADLAFDEANCGACGKVCRVDEACARGACYPKDCEARPCEEGSVCYVQACVPERCVGVVCAAGTECRDGACVCTTNEGCSGGRLCKSGACVACGDSEDDALCGEGMRCLDGACVPDPCAGVVCPAGRTCIGGVCQAECVTTQDCAGGKVCKGGACVACAGASDDARCGTERICVGGSCIRGDCRSVADCVGGQVCKAHVCSSCVDGADDGLCGAGQSCVGGVCAMVDAGVPLDGGSPAGCDAGSGWCEGTQGCIPGGTCCTSSDCSAALPFCRTPGGPCVAYDWALGSWGSCSVGCGTGSQSREVACADSTGVAAADSLCPQPKPSTQQDCTGINCGPFCSITKQPSGQGDCPEGPVTITFPQLGCSCATYDASGNGAGCGLGYMSWQVGCADGSAAANQTIDPGSCWCHIIVP
ncbi:MAG: hypothetical protein QM765_36735 [Myxococcales bacterium]